MRTLFIVAALAFATTDTRADLAAPPDSFRGWVAQWSAAHDSYISDWWSAELDGDDIRERIALVCRRETKYESGDGVYLVERGRNGARFAIGFQVDGRTTLCNSGPPSAPPPFRTTAKRTIDHFQGFHHGAEEVGIALRHGVPVLVRYRYDAFEVHPRREEHEQHDWDRICAASASQACYPDVTHAESMELTLLAP